MTDDERRFIKGVTTALDAGVEDLDGATRSRLSAARAHALEAGAARRRVWWVPMGGAVFASLLAATLWLGRPVPLPVNGLNAQDFEMLTMVESLELYQQDLEFFQWLEEDAHAG